MMMTNFSLLISLVVHITITYWLVSFTHISPVTKSESVPISLNMFKPEPLPVLAMTVPTLALEPHAKFVAPTLMPLKPRLKKRIVKKKIKRQVTKRITKSKVIKTKQQPKPAIKQVKPVVKTKSHPVVTKQVKQIVKTKPKFKPVTKQVKSVDAERAYSQKLRRLIVRKKTYPRRARKMGLQGTVRVSFVILANGTINNVKIVKSSNHRSLDNAAQKLIRKISGLLPFGKQIKRKQWYFNINIEYTLR